MPRPTRLRRQERSSELKPGDTPLYVGQRHPHPDRQAVPFHTFRHAGPNLATSIDTPHQIRSTPHDMPLRSVSSPNDKPSLFPAPSTCRPTRHATPHQPRPTRQADPSLAFSTIHAPPTDMPHPPPSLLPTTLSRLVQSTCSAIPFQPQTTYRPVSSLFDMPYQALSTCQTKSSPLDTPDRALPPRADIPKERRADV